MMRLKVRAVEAADIGERVAWFNDRSISDQMPLEVPVSEAGTRQWLGKVALDPSRKDFVVVQDSDGGSQIVAMAGLTDIDRQHRRCQLYVVVRPQLTGQGVGTPVVQWLCNFGFTHLAMARIFLYTLEHNHAARRFYARLGFTEEGCLRQHHLHRGAWVDRYVQGLLRQEWLEQTWSSEEPVPFEIRL